jgi:hypothetical protein
MAAGADRAVEVDSPPGSTISDRDRSTIEPVTPPGEHRSPVRLLVVRLTFRFVWIFTAS